MGSVGNEVQGNGLALMPMDTSKNVELTRKFTFETGIQVPLKIVMSTDGSVLDSMYNSISDMKQKYPSAMRDLTKIEDYANNNSFAATNGTSLAVNTAYFGNTQGLETLYNSTVSSGFHPAGTTADSIVIHELGHVAVHSIGKKLYPDEQQFRRAWNNGTLPARLVHEAYKEIQSAPNSYGFHSKLPSERALRGAISRYSLKNFHETIAEAWADYHANGNSSKAMSRAIFATMSKYL